MDCQTLSIPQAAKVLGIGRLTAYAAAKNGKLPVLRLGRRLVVPKPALAKLLEQAGTTDKEVSER